MAQAWVELSTLEAPDYFGEAAVLRRGVRHATAIATSSVEVLVLAKLDFDLKVDAETRNVVGVLVAQYPKDPQLLRCALCLVAAEDLWHGWSMCGRRRLWGEEDAPSCLSWVGGRRH